VVEVSGSQVFAAGEVDGRSWLARVSSDGGIVWELSWGAAGTRFDGLDAAPWGAVYVTGGSRLLRFTPEGALVWARHLDLDREKVLSGVAAAPGRVLYVAAGGGYSVWEGDLWRMRP
jgi:hypothetical protein